MVAVAVVAAAGSALAGCGAASSAATSHAATAQTHRSHHGQTVEGISITLPEGWTLRRDPVPSLVEPSLRFAAGSWRLPAGGNGCAPSRAITSEPATAALFWVYEYAPGHFRKADFPPQPKRFRLGRLGGPYECLGVRAYKILFRSHGRYFQVHVILGKHATRLRRAVVTALSSLRVERAG